MPSTPVYYRLHGVVKDYDWGESAEKSMIQDLLPQACPTIAHKKNTNPRTIGKFSELWFGAHSHGSATILYPENLQQMHGSRQSISLQDAIAQNPNHFLGEITSKKKDSRTLPFLCKILAASIPLSIQAHPDHEMAMQLHNNAPSLYHDNQQKPEIAVCLENFSALIGFQPWDHLAEIWKTHENHWMSQFWTPPPSSTDTDSSLSWFHSGLTRLCQAKSKEIATIIQQKLHVIRTNKGQKKRQADQLFTRMITHFDKKDRGVLFVYLMRYYRIKSDDALFIRPNLLHTYLHGRIFECMTNSDNTVRLGLTQKHCDTKTLLAMLMRDLSADQKESPVIQAKKIRLQYTPDQFFWRYPIPTPEFQLARTLTENKPQVILCKETTILFCASTNDHRGKIRFFCADTQKTLGEHLLAPGTALFLPADLSQRNILIEISQIAAASSIDKKTNLLGKPRDINSLPAKESAGIKIFWCSTKSSIC